MILKKPYAFLIKYFRIIHLVLAFLLLFLTIKITNIVSVLNEYVSSGLNISIGTNAGSVITFYMYLAIIGVILLAVAVYILLKRKEKPYKYYQYLIIYYLIIFVMLTVCFGIFKSLEIEVVDLKIIIAYRDVALIITLPQYFFLIYTFVRGIGFDIKKFNFNKDLNEMEIAEDDREEFEVAINLEGYKVKRKVRRTFRELKYYIAENPFASIVVSAVLIILIVTGTYMNKREYSKVYNEKQSFKLGNLKLSIQDTFITKLDYNGKIVTKDKYYLVVDMKITNNTNIKTTLLLSDFRLQIKGRNVLPTLNKNEYFVDISNPYYNNIIAPNTINNYFIVYELSKNEIKDEYELLIEENIDFFKGEIVAKYRKTILKPYRNDNVRIIDSKKINEEIIFTKSNLEDTKLTISNPEYTKSYSYKYNFCYKDKCQVSTNVIDATYQTEKSKILLIYNYKLDFDNNISYKNNIKQDKEFFINFLELEYEYNGKTYVTKPIIKDAEGLENKIVLETDYEIKDANSIKMLFTVRNKEYYITLK